MSKARFYLCQHCKNLIGMIDDKGVPIVCCGEKMKALEPNTTEAAGEKHLPVVSKSENRVSVSAKRLMLMISLRQSFCLQREKRQ